MSVLLGQRRNCNDGSNKGSRRRNKIIGNKHHRDELAKEFKDNDSPLKIAIVVDMWANRI